MTYPIPALPETCVPVDLACSAEEWAEFSQEVQDRAMAYAGITLRALSGYRLAGCPTTVRPCRSLCGEFYNWFWQDGAYYPVIGFSGEWVNVLCGCGIGDCGCGVICEIALPGPIAEITEVKIDGEVVNPVNYRVDNYRTLVWTGGGTCEWPICQDMSKPDTEEGTFSVTYSRGIKIDGIGAYAAGVLAYEYAKGCSGMECRLPIGTTAVSRQGVSFDVQPPNFANGLTGIPEVDNYIFTVNPNHLVQPSRVLNVDRRGPRQTTWSV